MSDWQFLKSGSTYTEITPFIPNPHYISPIEDSMVSNIITQSMADGSKARIVPQVVETPDNVKFGWFHQSGTILTQQLKRLSADSSLINIRTHVPESNWTGKFKNVKAQWDAGEEIFCNVMVEFERYT